MMRQKLEQRCRLQLVFLVLIVCAVDQGAAQENAVVVDSQSATGFTSLFDSDAEHAAAVSTGRGEGDEDVPPVARMFETVPDMFTRPAPRIADFFSGLIGAEHDEVRSALADEPIGIQPIPERPPLLIELNEAFLGTGPLAAGIELPTGAIWRPAFWVFGDLRSGVQYADSTGPVAEWANRLDLFGQLNLTGTERILGGMRPFDEETASGRTFNTQDFRASSIAGWNADMQTLFFEGDFGELFPDLDPEDIGGNDIGFSVGRMPLSAQQGLLIAEDRIDAFTVTRNSVATEDNLNLRMSGIYAWDQLHRNSARVAGNQLDNSSQLVALLTESDFRKATVNLDVAYVHSQDEVIGDVIAFGVSAIQRHHLLHNTYNTSLHFLASYPTTAPTAYADQGELLFSRISWTPHHTEDLIYLNSFWAIDQFTSPTRGPLAGGALGQTGVLFSAPGLGRIGAPIGVRTDNRAGTSLGYQMFFDHTKQQVIFEIGGQKETKGDSDGAIGSAVRYQSAMNQHVVFIWDAFVVKPEHRNTAPGARFEILVRF